MNNPDVTEQQKTPAASTPASGWENLAMTDEELAKELGMVCVSGDVLSGNALVKYLNLMPPADKQSMLDDLALLRAWAIMERVMPDSPNAEVSQSAGRKG